MKIGDHRQAGVLAIVALAAICFLALQMAPAPENVRLPQGKVEAGSTNARVIGLPDRLSGRPFSHAKFIDSDANKPAEPHVATPGASAQEEPLRPLTGTLPRPAWNPSAGGVTVQPVEDTGLRQQPEQELKLRIGAILKIDRYLAVIQTVGEEERSFSVGDMIFGKARILRIDESGIDLQIGKRKRRIAVGEEFSL